MFGKRITADPDVAAQTHTSHTWRRLRRRTTTPRDPAGADGRYLDANDERAVRTRLVTMVRELPATIRRVVALVWAASPAATVAALLAQVASAALAAFGLAATTSALTPLFATGPTPRRVAAMLPALVLITAAYALRGLLDSAATFLQSYLAPAVRTVAHEQLFAALMSVDLTSFDEASFADALARARDRGIIYTSLIVEQLASLTGTLANLLSVSVVLGILNPLLVPLVAATTLPRGLATLRSVRTGYDTTVRSAVMMRHQYMLTDLMSERDAATEARAYNAEPFLIEEHTRAGTAVRNAETRAGQLQARNDLIGRTLGGAGIVVSYLTLGFLLSTGAMPLAVAGTAVFALRGVQAAINVLFQAVSKTYAYGLFVADHARFVADASTRRPTATGNDVPRDFHEITADDLTFTYPGARAPAVRAVNLTIRRGQIIALVGENGSGKTTLAKLLAGLYLPQHGRLCWDGRDVSTMAPRAVREHVAYINQQPVRWPMTARANIALGRYDRVDPREDALVSAARDSGAEEIIDRLAEGYGTLLAPRFAGGTDLSGGQWQRLAIARAFYRDAPLLICDEPSAALDPRAEAAIFDHLRRLAAGRTLILISHRLANVREADHIYVLEHGTVIEQGDHQQLMSADGVYADLYTTQAAAYTEAALTTTNTPTS